MGPPLVSSGSSSALVGSFKWWSIRVTIVTGEVDWLYSSTTFSSSGLVGLLGSQVGLSSALEGWSSGIMGSLGTQFMLPHGLVSSQRSQVIV